jgi:hypothetical protein
VSTTPGSPQPPSSRAAQEASILADLRGAGVEVPSIHALREHGGAYRRAVPVLTAWLPRVTDFGLHESILRALAVPFAKPDALQPVIDDFTSMDTGNEEADVELRWVAGNALDVLWDDRSFEELRDICADPSYGRARQMVVLGMGKSKHPEAPAVLIRLLGDDGVRLHAVQALRKLRPASARPVLVELRPTQDAFMRREIDKTLAKLGA